MLRFRFALIAAVLLAAAPLFVRAQTATAPAQAASAAKPAPEKTQPVPFRIGAIYSAEISPDEPPFEEKSPFDVPSVKSPNPAWAEVVVKVDNGRSLSRFDYELVGKGSDPYPCFAVAEGSDIYSTDPEKWIIKKTSIAKYYRLLFPVSPSELSNASGGLVTMTLKMKLYETALEPPKIKLRVMPKGIRFTGVSIKPGDVLFMSYDDMPDSYKSRR